MPILIFLFGAMVGSFLNVVLLRKNTGETIVFGHSRCFSCGHTLTFWDLIPIFSFLFLRGRCRYCGSGISWQYPIVEFLTGLLASIVYLKIFNQHPFFVYYVYYFAAFCALFLVAAYDLKKKIIDNGFLYVFSAFAVFEVAMRQNLTDDIASSFFIAMFFYLMWLGSGGKWMGRGDADIAFVSAIFLGWPLNTAMLILSFWAGGLVGLLLLLLRTGKLTLKSEIPFAPFLASSTFAIWYFADFVRGFYGIIQ